MWQLTGSMLTLLWKLPRTPFPWRVKLQLGVRILRMYVATWSMVLS